MREAGAVVGIGTDLCAVSRVERAIGRGRFLERVYTPGERAYLDARGAGRAQSAAAMYAAKEAVMKALGTGIACGVFFDQIEVTHDAQGAPGVTLSGEALARMRQLGGVRALLSLSHEGDMAVAFVIIMA